MEPRSTSQPRHTDPFEALPLIDATRPALRWRPGAAWHHFRKLLQDKERTEEVFPIFEALPWRGLYRAATAFLTSEVGRSIRRSELSLATILDDHDALRRTPAGSLAHAYCDFMESEGLTAQGLADDFAKFAATRPVYNDQLRWYVHRLRDSHDLQHVLTGFGRDALGEQCVLAFTHGQQPSPAHLFLAYAAGLETIRRVRAPALVLRAVREAQRMGRACPRIAELPVRQLLSMQLDDARRMLNIAPPRHYHAAHAAWRAQGIDPYDLLRPVN